MNILVTGGAGFIGSHFIEMTIAQHPEDLIVNFDALTYAADLDFVANMSAENYVFIKGDIRDVHGLQQVMETYKIDAIVNFAAESHVDRSILNPEIFLETNVQGTMNLLNLAKMQRIKRFVQISTDEVYGSVPAPLSADEHTTLNPSSPYAASKAAADMFAISFAKTFDLNISITRSSNNYGTRQNAEKLIPKSIMRVLNQKPVSLYGDETSYRQWLAVEDNVQGINCVLRSGRSHEVYNLGGNEVLANEAVLTLIQKEMHVHSDIEIEGNRPGFDQRYAIDSTKVMHELGWQPTRRLSVELPDMIEWYQHKMLTL